MPEVSSIFPKNEAEEVVKVGKAIQQTDDALLKFTNDLDNLIKKLNQQEVSFKDLVEIQKKVAKTTQDIDKVGKQLVQTEEKLKQIQDTRTESVIKNRVEIQKQTKEIKDKIKASQADKLVTEAQNGAYDKIAKSLSSNIAKWKQMTKEERENTKAGRDLTKTIQRQDSQLKKLDSQIGRSQRHVGDYGRALGGVARNLLGAFGVVGGLAMFAKVLKDAFSTVREFTKENAVLAGVLGTTRDQVEKLTEQAVSLGSQYPILASEVTKLQVSYARLGFTQAEIIDLTEATIQGSIALNSSLDDTATLVGAVVKAYSSLGTSDSVKIIDQLTLSTQRSSLSFESLEIALPKVAGAASALNESLSGTLSKLAIAQDATLDASVAGTSLRNIYLEITKKGLTYDEALEKINNSSNKLNTAFELFGKRGAIVGLALANNIEKAAELKKEFDETGGVAEAVAKEQMDTLDGSIKSLQSSWEKMILGFRESDGVWRKVIDSATQFIDTFSDKRISGINKFIELSTLGFWDLATQQQQALSQLEKRIAKSNSRQIQYTLDLHREELENGGKFEKAKLQLLEKALIDKREAEKAAAEDKAKRDKKAQQDAELQKLAAEREASEKSEKERLAAEKKANKEIEEERTRHNNELRKIDEKIVADTSKFLAKERVEKETESNEIRTNLELDALDKFKEINEQRVDADLAYADKVRDIEEQKRIAKLDTLDAIRFIAGEETTIGKAATAAMQIEAIRQNLISLGIIGAKQAEGVAKSAAAAPFPFNIPLIAGTVAQFVSILSLFKKSESAVAAFATGTDNAPSEFVAGEKGRELIHLKTGELIMADNATYFKGQEYKGATVYTNAETEKIIAQSSKGNNFVFDDSGLKKELQLTRKAIQNKPIAITDNSGKIIGKQGKNYREIYLNRLRNGR